MPHHYRNPILDEDWPDPDVIRVGEEYLMVASSFNRAPGLPVLRSSDLMNWRIASHALAEVPPAAHYRLPRHGGGVWAPAIRAHAGTLYIVWPDPDHGIYVTTAPAAEGPWSQPHLLLAGQGLIDPCPLWDDDGRAYLVHGWAGSRSGIKNRLTVIEVSADLSRPLSAGTTVIDGADLPEYGTLEGPKFYQRDGWYWIFAPAGGVATGWQSVFRSRSIYGPYEARIVLAQGNTPVNGPHQGAWVTTPEGADWFLHFQDRGPYGRVTHLQPMTWTADGWPELGEAGMPVPSHPAPVTETTQGMRAVDGSDDFTGANLNPKWHWQANPGPAQHRHGNGHLDLVALANDLGNLRQLPQVLSQQLPGLPCVFETSVELIGAVAGTRAGLVILGREYTWIGLLACADGHHLICRRLTTDDSPDRRLVEETIAEQPLAAGTSVQLRLDSDGEGETHLSWAAGSADWAVLPAPVQPAAGQWIGAEVGLFATAPLGAPEHGIARYGAFTMRAVEPALVGRR